MGKNVVMRLCPRFPLLRHRAAAPMASAASFLALLLVALVVSGCATSRPEARSSHPFQFENDTFAFANELVWDYYFDAEGKWSHKRHEPEPDYTHHCFVLARSVQQFFQHAKFDGSQPKASDAMYRQLIRRVCARSLRTESPEHEKITFPGYANLRTFSSDHARLLKAECGGAWQSYFQRGHWRVVWPFTRAGQERVADSLEKLVTSNRSAVVHLIRFPQLTINHAVVTFASRKTEKTIEFSTYDPNQPEKPSTLIFDRSSRTFIFSANDYFIGGKVNAYQIYHTWWY